MKRLLLSSSSIKPVNIRIVSNGVQCADLKMLKENFCISDIKDVLDGRLVNWLKNIGENDLADRVKEKYSTPDSLSGHECYFCELFFDNFTLKDYTQILFREKTDNLLTKEINRIPDILVEAYKYCPTKFPILRWKTFFDICKYDSEEFNQIKEKIADKQKQIEYDIKKEIFEKHQKATANKEKQTNNEIKNQESKATIEDINKFEKYLVKLLEYNAMNYNSSASWSSWIAALSGQAIGNLESCNLSKTDCKYAEDLIQFIEHKGYKLDAFNLKYCMREFLKNNNLTMIRI